VIAIYLYTHDLRLEKNDNLYFKLNEMLRRRTSDELLTWSTYLYYFLNGLQKLPSIKTTVYRGIPIDSLEKIKKRI